MEKIMWSRIGGNWLREELVDSWKRLLFVLILSLGYFIYGSSLEAFRLRIGNDFRFTDYPFLLLIRNDAAVLSAVIFYLFFRGWNIADLKIALTWKGTKEGVVLLIVTLLIVHFVLYGALYLGKILRPDLVANSSHVSELQEHPTWELVVSAIIINAFFEQVICISYAFNQIAAKTSPFVAIVGVTFLRLAYHTWQSFIPLLGTLAAFVLYGVWYSVSQKVWPLIFTQIIFDLSIAFG